ncbi:MAG: hypothetical protein J6S23_06260 [Clostridia bacterium]|nr:hypothetical protein [Clostridia bacterium]
MDGYKGYKAFLIGLIVLFVAIGGLFTFMFCNSFYFYSEFDLDYSDLTYEELTFDRFEKKRAYKSSTRYEIYFNEYDKPFEISTITNKKLDKSALSGLKENEVMKVYYREASSKNYDYVICEIKTDTVTLLSLADYVETNQNNQVAGMIVCPILMLMSLFLIIVFVRYIKAIDDEGLGKIKIEYVEDGNVIRVYSSFDACSLVINDKVVARRYGIVSDKFELKGKIKVGDKKIPVKAVMSSFNIRLYYDGKMVAKKFMGFG